MHREILERRGTVPLVCGIEGLRVTFYASPQREGAGPAAALRLAGQAVSSREQLSCIQSPPSPVPRSRTWGSDGLPRYLRISRLHPWLADCSRAVTRACVPESPRP